MARPRRRGGGLVLVAMAAACGRLVLVAMAAACGRLVLAAMAASCGGLALVAMAAACGGPAPGPADASLRDSAGVRIIESGVPAWESGSAWRLSAEPVLSIGRTAGAAAYLFHGIVGAHRLSDGRIAVANYDPHEIRYFDAHGRHLMSAGGQGDGPGEFRFMSLVWRLPGDTLVVSDLRGLTLMGPTGDYVRSVQLVIPEGARRSQAVAQLDDGTILGQAGARGNTPPDGGQMVHDTLVFSRFEADGSNGRWFAREPGSARWWPEGEPAARRLPFSSRPAWAAAGASFYTASGIDPEVRIWRADGSLERIVRWSMPPRPVTPELVERYRAHLLGSSANDDARRRQQAFLAEVPMPDRLPAVAETRILVDDDANLWLERYQPPWEESREWIVLSADGDWLGSVGMPGRFTPLDIGADEVLGAWRDDVGVEYVRAYALIKTRR